MRILSATLSYVINAESVAAILCATLSFSLQALASAPADGTSIQGKLTIQNGRASILDSAGKKTPLESADDSIADTLRDVRLEGKELKLVGGLGPGGKFQVQDFFVVHGSTLFRLIYFCDTCHITTFRPGICVCCQQPTVPIEVPLSDPRVHHEDVKRPPSE